MGRAQQRNAARLAEFQRALKTLDTMTTARLRVVYRNMGFALYESLSVGTAGSAGGVNPYTGSPGTPVDTGFAVNSWWVAIGTPTGAPPAADVRAVRNFGATAAAKAAPILVGATPALPIYFVNNCAYIIPLEFGHSAKAPQGFIRLTTTGAQSLVNAVVAKVRTSGARA